VKPINKKTREWVLGCALAASCILVWWVHFYSPLGEKRADLAVELEKVSTERDRLNQRLGRLSNEKTAPLKMDETRPDLSMLLIQGQSPEAVSAQTQLWVQEFLESHGLSLTSYSGLAPSKWRGYSLGRVQFQLDLSTQGLSDLLGILEGISKAVRVETLDVSYRRGGENSLHVSLVLGTLFTKGSGE
jgi:hypothetical protein